MNRVLLGLSVIALAVAGSALAADDKPRDPPMPGMGLTRDRAQAGAEALFARLDVNHDGKIDAADRAARLDQIFDCLDTNHDGAISRAEFLAANTRSQPGPGPAMGPGGKGPGGAPGGRPPAGCEGDGEHGGERGLARAMPILREADPEHTGVITKAAFVAAALAIFDKSDTNHDGVITADERQAAQAAMGGGMGGMRMRRGGASEGGGDMPPPPPPSGL
jgi:Ca2+-binding EF-hand superfamily protein